ncbi:MAG: LCP family protein [Lachnospiraceae bacterium]
MSHRRRRRKKKNIRRENHVSKTVGIVIACIQAVISIVFMVVLAQLNMLPTTYMIVLGCILALLCGVILLTQCKAKKRGIAGKLISIILSISLVFGAFYVVKANKAVGKISGGDFKSDNIVVAVGADDKAKDIKDAKSYTFGVQYAMGGNDVKEAVAAISKEVGKEIKVIEYKNLSEQEDAFFADKVQGIIYNEAYTGMMEENDPEYSNAVKVIYKHEIKKELENSATKVEVKQDTFSVFISGIDVFGKITTNSRSDVNIIATINPTTHQVLLTTTPRDYYVQIPDVTGSQKDKLTHAGIYGVDASMRTLSALYDMKIDFYARVNFTSLIEMVDVLGGVDVESDYAFTTSPESGKVMQVEKGMNTFDGKEALAFSRERHNVPDGDNQRGKDQQAVIEGMINKMISPTILVNANGIIDSVSGNVETNMSEEQIQALIKQQLSDGASWNIQSVAATGTGDSQYCYSYAGKALYVCQPDQASIDHIKALVDSVENGETITVE